MTNEKYIFALGFFDGVHLGHQALLRECRELAQSLACETAAITFDQHPRTLFSDRAPALLSTLRDRQWLLRQYGMSHVHCLPVTSDVMATPWADFLEHLLAQGAVGFVCGDDFHFGHRGAGNAENLRRFCAQRNLPCVIVPEQTLNGQRISSTRIRALMEGGEMEAATQFLGHPHILTGAVIHGQQLGRRMGVPTANLLIPPNLVVPKFGVYACRTVIDGSVSCAVANVGTRPTVGGSGITVEPWILDFDGDLYGREIRLEFYRFLRPERNFESLAALQQQIHADAAETRRYFESKGEG